MFLINPNEPQALRDLLASDAIEQPMSLDFKIHYQGGVAIGERKEVPGDFSASWRDGRLTHQFQELAAHDGPAFLILEGVWTYRRDGKLMNGRYETGITFQQITNRLATLGLSGHVAVLYSPSLEFTARAMIGLDSYLRSTDHDSLLHRGGIRSEWGKATVGDKALYLLQGLPHVGVPISRILWKVAGTPRAAFNYDEERFRLVPKIGPVIAKDMVDILDMQCPEDFQV